MDSEMIAASPSKPLRNARGAQKEPSSNMKKELVQRLIRILMLYFTTYMEILKSANFSSNQYLKGLASNSSQSNQVMLDLKNYRNAY